MQKAKGGFREMSKEKKEVVVDQVLCTDNGRWPVFIKLFALVAIVGIISEIIGVKTIPLGSIGKVNITAMVFAMVIAVLLTPDALGKKIDALKNICGEKEVDLAENILSFMLLILGVKLGTSSGPNIMKILQAGPALILQEFGNLGTMLIGLPIAMILGMRREAFGATISICREPSLGLITERYGSGGPEFLGVMGTYMVGNLFGAVFFGILASLAVNTGLHPWALAMACGMGSGSMMTASSASLAATVPEMAEEIQAYAAMSNICSNIDGLYMECFIAIPVAERLYKVYSKMLGRKDA